MALTAEQDIPARPKTESEPWSVRRLFPMRATASAIVKMFVSPLEILLAWVFLIIGVAVIFERHIPLPFYVLACILLLGTLFERVGTPKVVVPEAKSKQKTK